MAGIFWYLFSSSVYSEKKNKKHPLDESLQPKIIIVSQKASSFPSPL